MSNPFVGEIRIFAGSFAPAGWMLCQGQLLPISENETLFNLIGTTYGGDGQETFGIPDLQGRAPIHMGTGAGGVSYVIGEEGGVESVTLSINQIPNHNHAFLVSQDQGSGTAPAGDTLGSNPTVQLYRPGVASQTFDPSALTATGGSQPHENMQPYLVMNYIISLFGIFPHQ